MAQQSNEFFEAGSSGLPSRHPGRSPSVATVANDTPWTWTSFDANSLSDAEFYRFLAWYAGYNNWYTGYQHSIFAYNSWAWREILEERERRAAEASVRRQAGEESLRSISDLLSQIGDIGDSGAEPGLASLNVPDSGSVLDTGNPAVPDTQLLQWQRLLSSALGVAVRFIGSTTLSATNHIVFTYILPDGQVGRAVMTENGWVLPDVPEGSSGSAAQAPPSPPAVSTGETNVPAPTTVTPTAPSEPEPGPTSPADEPPASVPDPPPYPSPTPVADPAPPPPPSRPNDLIGGYIPPPPRVYSPRPDVTLPDVPREPRAGPITTPEYGPIRSVRSTINVLGHWGTGQGGGLDGILQYPPDSYGSSEVLERFGEKLIESWHVTVAETLLAGGDSSDPTLTKEFSGSADPMAGSDPGWWTTFNLTGILGSVNWSLTPNWSTRTLHLHVDDVKGLGSASRDARNGESLPAGEGAGSVLTFLSFPHDMHGPYGNVRSFHGLPLSNMGLEFDIVVPIDEQSIEGMVNTGIVPGDVEPLE